MAGVPNASSGDEAVRTAADELIDLAGLIKLTRGNRAPARLRRYVENLNDVVAELNGHLLPTTPQDAA